MKKLFILILSVFLLTLVPASVFAQKTVKATPASEAINSFELFWPLVAGKTKGDKFYSLKTFKENLRGSLIFGKPQKADYSLFKVTKRILEVEELSKEGRKDFTLQTLDVILSELVVVEKNILASNDDIKSTVNNLNLKFDNLETFLPWLISQYKDKDLKDKTQLVLDKVIELHKKI